MPPSFGGDSLAPLIGIGWKLFWEKHQDAIFFDGSRTFSEMAEAADSKLFKAITSNQDHVLYPLLPQKKGDIMTKLRNRPHCYMLPSKKAPLMDKNYMIQMLYKDIY